MSSLRLSGKTSNPDSKILIENKNLEIDNDGNFNLNIDIFKKDGGQKKAKDLESLAR